MKGLSLVLNTTGGEEEGSAIAIEVYSKSTTGPFQ